MAAILRQHLSSAANCQSVYGSTNNNYVIPIPNQVGAGNCLILGITFDVALSISSVSDNINGTWAAATVTASGGTNKSAVCVFPNAGAGQTTITVVFSAVNSGIQFEVSEYSGIATSSAGAGSVSAADVAAPNLASGAFTPTNNNGTGGNLLWAYFAMSWGPPSGVCPTSMVPSGSFTLLSSDISGKTNDMFPKATSYWTQTTSASINPGMTATGDNSGDLFNCLCVALKLSTGAGTVQPAGVWVKRVTMQSPKQFDAGTHTVQLPTTGNLHCIFFDTVTAGSISGITDNQSNAWTQRGPGSGSIEIWHTVNSTPSTNLIVTITFSGSSGARWTLFAFDIESADVNPYQTHSIPVEIDTSGDSFVDDAPTITPTAQPGISLAYLGTGIGPVTGFHAGSPSGALFIAPTYTGETDGDFLTNAAGLAMLYHTNTNQQHWNWVINNDVSNTAFPAAIVFTGGGGVIANPGYGMTWFPGAAASGGPAIIAIPTGLGPPNKS